MSANQIAQSNSGVAMAWKRSKDKTSDADLDRMHRELDAVVAEACPQVVGFVKSAIRLGYEVVLKKRRRALKKASRSSKR